ncbi:transcription factor GTE11-like [Vicia villosa]|uniref:transcription factor GTE11-like n=1 Tax=Vicia villosa TaxID=3911 RepID=UPI00273CB256|nr:transcription factor GTE11-like [Vicia villosa]XP_058771393.1 transcription factor GTE11-like [Vicia villosa]XP_058771394.1 transcription factor GTE11-like [Vicia villosa]
MIATETIAPTTKLKIKFSTKRIEVVSGPKCQFGEKVSQLDANRPCNSIKKSSPLYSKKREPSGNIEGPKNKRQKIDRKGSQMCAAILKCLSSHQYSWVFMKPVDPVALNIPDYFMVISHPMDLGTIKSKLEKNVYYSKEEFAADVRLTFSNAMTYNPPSNDVHLMANDLNKLFDRKWKDMDKKWNCEDELGKSVHGKNETGIIKETVRKSCIGTQSRHKDSLTKRSRASEHKGIHKISSLTPRDAKVEAPKLSQIPCKPLQKDLIKGSEDREPTTSSAAALRQDCKTKITSPLQRKSDPGSDGAVSSLDSEHTCPSSQHTTLATDASSGEVWSTAVLPVQLSPKKALRAAMLKSRFADTILKAQQKTLLEHGDKCDPLKMQLEKERLERIQREEQARIEAQIKTAEAAARMRAEEETRQQIEKEREAARAAIEKMKRSVDIEHNLEIVKELESLSGCTLSYKALGGRNGYRTAMGRLDKLQFENPLERLGLFIKDDYVADEDEEVLNGGGVWEEGEIF